REQCTGMFWERDAARQFWLECLFYLGDLKTLHTTVRAGLREAEERGAIYTGTNLRTGLANAVWLMDAEPEAARAALAEAMKTWSVQGFHLQHWYALIGEVHVALYEGKAEAAHQALEARWPELTRSHLLRLNHTRLVAHHLRGRIALARALGAAVSDRQEGIEAARRVARQLQHDEPGWGQLLGELLELGARAAAADKPPVQRVLALVERLTAADMGLYAFALRCVALADPEPLAAQGVREPEKFARMLVPGFG
ncbi:MAG TPA: hypothetical protein VFZ61_02595, partial [Polyangiales bacterium]